MIKYIEYINYWCVRLTTKNIAEVGLSLLLIIIVVVFILIERNHNEDKR